MRVFNLLSKLNRIVQDFHELALKADIQDKDTRIVQVTDSIPSHVRTEAKIPVEQIDVWKRSIRNAQELVEGWYDEYKENLGFFLNNPKFQEENFETIIRGFRRLMYGYNKEVVEESILFMEKADAMNEEGVKRFNKFKEKYNDLVNRLSSFLKDVKEAGYDAGGEGWEVEGIFKELKDKMI